MSQRQKARPGGRLRVIADRFFDGATAERYLFPAIADLQHEARTRMAAAGIAAWRIKLVAYAAFWRTFAACALRRSPGEPGLLASGTVVPAALALAVVTVLLAVEPIGRIGWPWLGRLGAWPLVELFGELLPQALAVALPVCVLFAGFVALGRSHRDEAKGASPASIARSIVLLSASAAILGLFVLVYWTPGANQAFRERQVRLLTGRPEAVPKGPSEMTITELREALSQTRATPQERVRWRYHLHVKTAIPTSAIAFGFLTISVGRRARRWPRLRALALSLAVVLLYYVVLASTRDVAVEQRMPAWLAAWSSNLAVAASATVFALLGIRRAG